jgi:hypothetical protein
MCGFIVPLHVALLKAVLKTDQVNDVMRRVISRACVVWQYLRLQLITPVSTIAKDASTLV